MDPILSLMMANQAGGVGSGFNQTNPYSNYATGALPFPPSYGGTPANAQGQPIASYQAPQPVYTPPSGGTPGMTLNNAGMGANSLGAALDFGFFGQPQALSGMGSGNPSLGGYNPYMVPEQMMGFIPQQGASQGSQGSPGGWSTANNWNAALAALSSPGQVTTPGIKPPAGPAYQPSSGVLNQFLSTRPAGLSLASGAPNSGFLNSLSNLRASGMA